MSKFIAVVYKRKRCPECDQDAKDGYELGLYERIDCGCMFAVEIGRYETLKVARLVAAGEAKRKGTRHGGRNTGHWNVETDEDGVIEAS